MGGDSLLPSLALGERKGMGENRIHIDDLLLLVLRKLSRPRPHERAVPGGAMLAERISLSSQAVLPDGAASGRLHTIDQRPAGSAGLSGKARVLWYTRVVVGSSHSQAPLASRRQWWLGYDHHGVSLE